MLQLFAKKWAFSFLLIFFAITFVAGFFIWNFNKLNSISSELFTASVLPKDNTKIGNEEPDLTSISADLDLSDDSEISSSIDDPPQEIGVINIQESQQDLLDDIKEKLDIISQQVQILVAERNKDDVSQEIEEKIGEKIAEDTENQEEIAQNENVNVEAELLPVQTSQVVVVNSGGGGASSATAYPKILISEMQIAPIEQRFIELYNPKSESVDLTGWYLQRKTETGADYKSFITKTNFSEKMIPAKGYFLISRADAAADILIDDLTLTENNSFILKNPNGEISDEVILTQDKNPAEQKSLGRIGDDFEFNVPTPKAQNVKWIEPPPPPPPTDAASPEISFSLDAIVHSLEFKIIFTITDPIVGAVSPSGIDSYVFRWSDDGIAWQEDNEELVVNAPLSFSANRNFTGEEGKVYRFQAKAKDLVGNESEWLPVEPAPAQIILQKKIIINEIQISGQTAKDEFIELYNPNSFDVDLSGFALKKKTSGGNESNLVSSAEFSGTILSLGRFLIAPQPDDDGTLNYMGSAIPDLYYSGKSYSVASDNTVLLYGKDGDLQDKVGFGAAVDYETAPGPNPDDGKSIDRKNLEDTDDNSQDFVILDTPTPRS